MSTPNTSIEIKTCRWFANGCVVTNIRSVLIDDYELTNDKISAAMLSEVIGYYNLKATSVLDETRNGDTFVYILSNERDGMGEKHVLNVIAPGLTKIIDKNVASTAEIDEAAARSTLLAESIRIAELNLESTRFQKTVADKKWMDLASKLGNKE